MTHSDTHVSPPDIHDRRSPSVIGVVHSQIVLLIETRLQRQYPVRPLLVRTALVRPERRLAAALTGGYGVALIRPAVHGKTGVARVCVMDLENGHLRKLVAGRHGNDLLQGRCGAGQGDALPGTHRIPYALAFHVVQSEITEFLSR